MPTATSSIHSTWGGKCSRRWPPLISPIWEESRHGPAQARGSQQLKHLEAGHKNWALPAIVETSTEMGSGGDQWKDS